MNNERENINWIELSARMPRHQFIEETCKRITYLNMYID